MTTRLLMVAVLAVLGVSAQSTELGGVIGGGAFAVSSGGAGALGQAGVEACLFCSGRLALFAEYAHWFSGNAGRTGFGIDRVRSADLAGAGLRIQSRGRLRPFFDVGLVGGRDKHANQSGGAIGGVVVGAGVGIPLGERWYVRPQVRASALSPHTIEGLSMHWFVGGSIGVGYRF